VRFVFCFVRRAAYHFHAITVVGKLRGLAKALELFAKSSEKFPNLPWEFGKNSHEDLVKLPWGFAQNPMEVFRVWLGLIFLSYEFGLELAW
jgi:hypothetical protein